jgi:hypothetical protein
MVFGLGYLVKAIMFPLSLLFLAVTLFAVRDLRLAIPRVLAAFLVLLLFSIPYIAVVSASKGEVAISSAGAFTYAKHVNGVPFSHWQGEAPGSGTPLHPSRKIFEAPPVYEFGTPIGGTYPISYDPAYWYEGLEIHFDLEQQIQALLSSIITYYEIFVGLYGSLLVGLILFYLMSRQPEWRLTNLLSDWGLAFIALPVFMFYAIVLVAERYIGVFVALFLAVLLANVRLIDTVNNRRIAAALSAIIIAFTVANILVFNLSGYRDFSISRNAQTTATVQPGPPSWPGEVAEELNRLGIEQGDRVGVIGYGFESFWARLAGVQIVAEMLTQDSAAFWLADPALQSEVLQTFAGTGVNAVVAESVPDYAFMNGWHQVDESNYYIYLLAQ